ncbi:kinesin-like protein Nod [Drosophila obscura]|uniref:kinesin-like protein Nod n=1 Tax=Drosophila obscura TaxID=7282 RepID=UPI001BB2D048|nr:kinesin-like protein Nod [Drosophila obscura]
MDNGKLSAVRVGVREAPFRSFHGRQEPSIVQFSPLAGNSLVVKQNDYHFDHAFRSSVSQQQLYDALIEPLVDKLFCGFQCTTMAYGQTGTGKSYSMGMVADNQVANEEHLGVLPRCLRDILDRVAAQQENTAERTKISASFIEVYNEKAYDLLGASPMDPMLSSRCQSPTCIPLASQEDMRRLLQLGTSNRHVRRTNMNANSSRSHAIVTIHVQRQGGQISRMNIVDLAGSEGLRRTGHEGVARQEGVSINMGLLSINKVVNAMAAGHAVIPYRDSVLTTVLQESLTSQSYLTLLACISPHDCDLSETVSTLRFAKSAKRLRLNPQQMQMARTHQLQQKVSPELCLDVVAVHAVEDYLAHAKLVELLVAGAQEAGTLQVGAAPRFDHLADGLQIGHILAAHRHDRQHHHGKEQAHGGLRAQLLGERLPRQQLFHGLTQPDREDETKRNETRLALDGIRCGCECGAPGHLVSCCPNWRWYSSSMSCRWLWRKERVVQLSPLALARSRCWLSSELTGSRLCSGQSSAISCLRHRVTHSLGRSSWVCSGSCPVGFCSLCDSMLNCATGGQSSDFYRMSRGNRSHRNNRKRSIVNRCTSSHVSPFQLQQFPDAVTPHAFRRGLTSSTTIKLSRPPQNGSGAPVQNSTYLMPPKAKASLPLHQMQRTRSEMGLTPKAKKRALEELQLEMTLDAPSVSDVSEISLFQQKEEKPLPLQRTRSELVMTPKAKKRPRDDELQLAAETTLLVPSCMHFSDSSLTLTQEKDSKAMGPPQPPTTGRSVFHSSVLSIPEEPGSQPQQQQPMSGLLFNSTCSPIVSQAAGPFELSGIQPLETSARPMLHVRRSARLSSMYNTMQSPPSEQKQKNESLLRRSMRLAVKSEKGVVQTKDLLATQNSVSVLTGRGVRSKAAATCWMSKHRVKFLDFLNTAEVRELQKMPGIGPKTAFSLAMQRSRLGGFQSLSQVGGLPIWAGKKWLRVCQANCLDP